MSVFDRQEKTRVIDELNGVERVGELARELGAGRVLLVTDPGIVAAGHVARAERALGRAGLAFARFDGVRENPTTEEVDLCLAGARAFGPDLFLGLGGGSSIDVAKGANFLLSCGGRMHDYRGSEKATAPLHPLIAVPTTAGTGSEVQSFALITDPETHQKMACGDPTAAPRIAVLDATLTVTMPSFVTACTGLDAVGHAVESVVSTRSDDTARGYAREAFRLAVRSFPRVLAEPHDLEARAEMLRAATLAGLAIEHGMLGAAHSMANPLTARFGLPHGQAVGTTLPYVVAFNAEEEGARRAYAELTEDLAATLRDLVAQAGLPTSLAPSGIAAGDVAGLAVEAAAQWTAQFNPRPVDESAFRRLFEAARAGVL